jgi:hypothetical protein
MQASMQAEGRSHLRSMERRRSLPSNPDQSSASTRTKSIKKRHHQKDHYLRRRRMHLNIRRIGSPEPSPKVTSENTKIFLDFIFTMVKTFSRPMVNNFYGVKTRIMIFCGGIKIFE